MPRLLSRARRATPAQPRRVVCHVCKKELAGSGDALRRHMRTHTGERPHRCATCGRGFTQASSLQTHEFAHLSRPQFACDICSCQFRYFANVRRHRERKHEGHARITFTAARRAADALYCAEQDLGCDEDLSVPEEPPLPREVHAAARPPSEEAEAEDDAGSVWGEPPAAIGMLPPLVSDWTE